MTNLENLGNKFSISIPLDEEGYLGRECPNSDCLGYFKITPGTGLQGEVACHCPYCGHVAEQDQFFTQAQIEYAQSIAIHQITGALLRDLKAMEFDHRPRGGFGIGISMKVTGHPEPIRYYQENQLETEVICAQCTLRYAIYGLFAFCPDCGAHNSLQILHKNLELAEKEIALATTVDRELAEHLVGDALENAVSSFDGFGRETCRVHAHHATIPAQVEKLSFQNIAAASQKVEALFGVNLSKSVTADEWQLAFRCFQKRHLLAHKMGIVDEAYLKATSDPLAVIGRKVPIQPKEVAVLISVLKQLGAYLTNNLPH